MVLELLLPRGMRGLLCGMP
uniref:Uncharacterized protein n=1 Tax=Arundo donax TaxID=35708 RepID=A0A0A8Z6Y4_ARUDO